MLPQTFLDALQAPGPGAAVRLLGPLMPGVRRTGQQIVDHAMAWEHDAIRTLDGDGPVLLVFGDSLSQGIGAENRADGYVSVVADGLGSELARPVGVINLSRSGARLRDVLEVQLPAFAAIHCPELEQRLIGGICTAGSNDLVRSLMLSKTRDRMSAVVRELPPGVAIATLPDLGSIMAKRLNKHLRAEAELVDRSVADVADALTSWRGRMAGDGFHPNEAGHRLWAEVVLSTLRSTNRGGGSRPIFGHVGSADT